MRMIQVADLHFGAEHQGAIAAASEVIKALEPCAIVVCGDLTQRGKKSEFHAARSWLDQFACPRLVVPGNHDTPLLNVWARANAPFARYRDFFEDLSFPLQLEGGVVAGLNTARGWQARKNWAEGSVDLEDMEVALAPYGAASPNFLICHHPFLSPPDSPLVTSTRRGARACQRLARSDAELLLTGHVHAPSATVRHGDTGRYLAVSAGTLSTRLRRHAPSFNLVSVSETDIRVTAFEYVKERFQPRRLGGWTRKKLEPFSARPVVSS